MAGVARLPADKLQKGRELLSTLATRRKVTLGELQQALGFLNFICKVISPGRAFLRRIHDLTRGVQRRHHYIRLSNAARADIHAWLCFLNEHNGISILRRVRWLSSDAIRLYSDAAASCGFAAVLGTHWLGGFFPVSWQSYHISILELYPIVVAVILWAPKLKDKCINFHCDNSNVVHAINSQTSKQPKLMALLRKLVVACLKGNILFTATHVPGYQNVIPDLISRFQVQRARQLAPWLDSGATTVPDSLQPQNILCDTY